MNGHRPEFRQNLGRGHGAPVREDFGYLLHDAVPELLGAEAVELVLDLGEAGRTRAASSSAAFARAASAAFPT
ncbi:hypothetical protein [Methylobacterium soli]|uniref:hypothetical protein n=1 Tax=Methylobacterium soli TaxID=553447 RepID=UPI001783168B|nr:hypothetical protein [Methylobacterium soli]GJE43029.1 hypothetical protein AEGHOMDF_2206 [Methylobacterium soli]